jgi:hypothetical protein
MLKVLENLDYPLPGFILSFMLLVVTGIILWTGAIIPACISLVLTIMVIILCVLEIRGYEQK